MSAIRILLGFICITAICRGNVRDGRIVNGMRPEQEARRQQFADLAKTLLGVREGKQANTGSEVTKYLKYVGVYVPAAWCAALVCWVFKLAGYHQPRTPWSPALFPSARLARDALKGNVIGIYFSVLKRIGHCGIIVDVRGDLIYSVEGNTNVAGSREGDGVYKRVRHKRSIAVIADWFKEVPL